MTQPRIGYAKVAQEKKTLSWLAIGGAATFLIAAIAYFVVTSGNGLDFIKGYFMFLFGAILATLAVAIAYWWLVNRWYAYAVLILLGVAAYQWLNFSLSFSFIIPGSVIVLFGLVTLVRFLRKYPVSTANGETNDVN